MKLNIWGIIEENPTEISGEPPLIQWLFNPNNAIAKQVCCKSFYSSKLRPHPFPSPKTGEGSVTDCY